MLIRKFPFIKKIHFVILCHFLISNCWGSFLLKNDEIMETHRSMSTYLKDKCQMLPEYFDKSNNLCTASIQFIYKNGEDINITKSEIIKRVDKPIITSSAYTQDIYEENSTEVSEILSWPFKNKDTLRFKDDESNFKKNKEPTGIYKKLFGDAKNHKNNNHEKCYKALDINLEQYVDLSSNLDQLINPIVYLKTKYADDYGTLSFADLKHSEPLIIKWIEQHIDDLKSQCLEKLAESSMMDDDTPLEILYPVIHFHTRRQTCSDCEVLIQKSAKSFRYVPIISFSDLYLSQKQGENCDPCSLQLTGGEKYFLPFSKLKSNFLDFDTIKKIRRFIKPRVKEYYVQKKYPLYSEIINKEFEDRTLNELKVCENYRQEKERLKGIKRFPIQFYAPF